MPKFVASIRRREHGDEVRGADNLRLERSSAKETKMSHTEECGEGIAGSGGTGAEGRQKQKTKKFCAASTALTGVTLKQLLRNQQDTSTLCGVVFDSYIVSSQLNAVLAAKAQSQA